MISLILILTLQGMAPMEQELGTDWLIERISWEAKIQPGLPIEVHNPYGDVRSRGTDDGKLAISGMVQKHKDDDQRIEFDIQETPEKIVINLIFQGDDELTYKKKGLRRADVTVYIPFGSPFRVSTLKGLLEVKGLKSDVDAYSERGKIFARINGHLIAKTRQGDITAVLKEAVWTRPIEIESILGEITVQLPANAGGIAIATTGGEITTDYSIEIKHSAGTTVKTGTARLGEGNQELRLTNHQGNIKILQGRWDVE